MNHTLRQDARKQASKAYYNAGVMASIATTMATALPGFGKDAFDNIIAHLEQSGKLFNDLADALEIANVNQ